MINVTCQNCWAQYHFESSEISQDGRIVRCSNCGRSWRQWVPKDSALDERQDRLPLEGLRYGPDDSEQLILRSPSQQDSREDTAQDVDELHVDNPAVPSDRRQVLAILREEARFSGNATAGIQASRSASEESGPGAARESPSRSGFRATPADPVVYRIPSSPDHSGSGFWMLKLLFVVALGLAALGATYEYSEWIGLKMPDLQPFLEDYTEFVNRTRMDVLACVERFGTSEI